VPPKALDIFGWMTAEELEWLAAKAAYHQRIVEIGCWAGRSTRALADSTSGEIYAIDTWNGDGAPGVQQAIHRELLHGKPEDWLLGQFNTNTADLKNIHIMQMTSLEAAVKLRDQKFDMIFIDASHDYENIKADILAWRSLLSEGGLLCGHDYVQSWPDVGRAVDELLPERKICEGTTIWYWYAP
jgi:predicted O-methyltransferase YrrM